MGRFIGDDVRKTSGFPHRGSRPKADKLVGEVYGELRQIARRQLSRERADHTLNTTALVHEAYIKLSSQTRVEWQNRAHFCAVAAQAMRRILLDYAKNRAAAKRGGDFIRVQLDEEVIRIDEQAEEIIALDAALTRLAEFDPRQAQIVELRYFGGMSIEDTASVMSISPATVKRDWNMAKAWLYRELHGNEDS